MFIKEPKLESGLEVYLAKKKKKAETPAEQKARLKKEGEAYDRKMAREDKQIANGLAYKGRKV